MNPEQWLNKVAQAIEIRDRVTARSFHIGWALGTIVCWPRRNPNPPDPIFGTFTDRNLERGLSRRQWEELKNKIAEFLEGQTK